jgi:hypothetical protein
MPESYSSTLEEWTGAQTGPWGTSLGDKVHEVAVIASRCTWNGEGDVSIPSELLRERLEGTYIAVGKRYPEATDEQIEEDFQQYLKFVEKYEELEKAGKNPRIFNSY